jgi:hypothetical protein
VIGQYFALREGLGEVKVIGFGIARSTRKGGKQVDLPFTMLRRNLIGDALAFLPFWERGKRRLFEAY